MLQKIIIKQSKITMPQILWVQKHFKKGQNALQKGLKCLKTNDNFILRIRYWTNVILKDEFGAQIR